MWIFLIFRFCAHFLSDILHNFALRKISAELDDIRIGPAARLLSRLDLEDYEFGTICPILKKFRLTEPEGKLSVCFHTFKILNSRTF